MSTTRRRYSQEFKDRLGREVIDSSKSVKTVATECGVSAETMCSWLKKYKETHGGAVAEPELEGTANAKPLMGS